MSWGRYRPPPRPHGCPRAHPHQRGRSQPRQADSPSAGRHPQRPRREATSAPEALSCSDPPSGFHHLTAADSRAAGVPAQAASARSYHVADCQSNIHPPAPVPGSSSAAASSAAGGSLAGPASSGLSAFEPEGTELREDGQEPSCGETGPAAAVVPQQGVTIHPHRGALPRTETHRRADSSLPGMTSLDALETHCSHRPSPLEL